MRRAYLVTYDICDEKRLRRVFRVMRGYGDHIQYSVFWCELSARERVELEGLLVEELNHGEDQVLLIDLGPAEGRAAGCVESLGRAFSVRVRGAIVV